MGKIFVVPFRLDGADNSPLENDIIFYTIMFKNI